MGNRRYRIKVRAPRASKVRDAMHAFKSRDHMEKGAEISPCGRYRWRLWRRWTMGPCAAFVMLNPSVADAIVDDPTIRRCMSFARRERCGSLEVVNLFAFRATNPSALISAAVPDGGLQGDAVISATVTRADLIVCAWGSASIARQRACWFADNFSNLTLMCLGMTRSGSPRHPLYARSDAQLIPWSAVIASL